MAKYVLLGIGCVCILYTLFSLLVHTLALIKGKHICGRVKSIEPHKHKTLKLYIEYEQNNMLANTFTFVTDDSNYKVGDEIEGIGNTSGLILPGSIKRILTDKFARLGVLSVVMSLLMLHVIDFKLWKLIAVAFFTLCGYHSLIMSLAALRVIVKSKRRLCTVIQIEDVEVLKNNKTMLASNVTYQYKEKGAPKTAVLRESYRRPVGRGYTGPSVGTSKYHKVSSGEITTYESILFVFGAVSFSICLCAIIFIINL